MVHTAITADADVRRLPRLGETKHDWREACPAGERLSWKAGVARFRIGGVSLVRDLIVRVGRRTDPTVGARRPPNVGGIGGGGWHTTETCSTVSRKA
jgi:hypothetical protein